MFMYIYADNTWEKKNTYKVPLKLDKNDYK